VAVGTAEPTSWTLTASDTSTQLKGFPAGWVFGRSRPTGAKSYVDNYSIVDNPAPVISSFAGSPGSSSSAPLTVTFNASATDDPTAA